MVGQSYILDMVGQSYILDIVGQSYILNMVGQSYTLYKAITKLYTIYGWTKVYTRYGWTKLYTIYYWTKLYTRYCWTKLYTRYGWTKLYSIYGWTVPIVPSISHTLSLSHKYADHISLVIYRYVSIYLITVLDLYAWGIVHIIRKNDNYRCYKHPVYVIDTSWEISNTITSLLYSCCNTQVKQLLA